MRVSIRKNDPGYVEDGYKYKVFLDSVEVKYCFTADEKRGKAFTEVVDYSVAPAEQRRTQCLQGHVVIKKVE